jgi:hypothetical protein
LFFVVIVTVAAPLGWLNRKALEKLVLLPLIGALGVAMN